MCVRLLNGTELVRFQPVTPFMNTKTVGERSEAHVLAALLKAGYVILMPFGDNQRYDLVIDDGDGKFRRVQVKTARLNSAEDALTFSTCSTVGYKSKHGRKGYKGQCELFAAYEPSAGSVYLVPVCDVANTSCCLRLKANKRLRKTMRFAADYELAIQA